MEFHALVENFISLLAQEALKKLGTNPALPTPELEQRFEEIELNLLEVTERTECLGDMRDEHNALRHSVDNLADKHDDLDDIQKQCHNLEREIEEVKSITQDYEEIGDNLRSEIRVALKRCSTLLGELEKVFC